MTVAPYCLTPANARANAGDQSAFVTQGRGEAVVPRNRNRGEAIASTRASSSTRRRDVRSVGIGTGCKELTTVMGMPLLKLTFSPFLALS
jgi:hypothetical protein